ncbi:MAG TPA: YceI family protein [Candidatus Acidoferrales bacterium]|jgi:polyisoprenoid-binding protein YceI|nr:YceI family protein [Candidatus Acidoferrales bacterium]
MNRKPKILKHFSVLVTLPVATALVMLMSTLPARAQALSVQIDPAQSKVEYSLNSTVHTVHGTFAVKNGSVHYDPSSGQMSGTIVVDATTGQSGNNSRDGRMHREILESAKFPEIVFSPTTLTGAVAADGISKVEVSGHFRLHGKEHDVTLPVEVKTSGRNLDITAHMEIPYVKWGLKNPSNFLLHVSETVTIEIQARGNIQGAGNP